MEMETDPEEGNFIRSSDDQLCSLQQRLHAIDASDKNSNGNYYSSLL